MTDNRKYLRLGLRPDLDERVISLANEANVSIQEALGTAIMIWCADAGHHKVQMPKWLSEETAEKCGLVRKNIPSAYMTKARYMDLRRRKDVTVTVTEDQ